MAVIFAHQPKNTKALIINKRYSRFIKYPVFIHL